MVAGATSQYARLIGRSGKPFRRNGNPVYCRTVRTREIFSFLFAYTQKGRTIMNRNKNEVGEPLSNPMVKTRPRTLVIYPKEGKARARQLAIWVVRVSRRATYSSQLVAQFSLAALSRSSSRRMEKTQL